jgi:sporulation integral membrane protein YlbJ
LTKKDVVRNMKKVLYGLVVFILMLFMFIRPIEAVAASKTGLLLWFQTIIPTLLPFMILSNLMIQLDIIQNVTFLFGPVFRKLLKISNNGSYALLIGFLCGYPMGAKTTSDMVTKQLISKEEGQYLLSFCNNVSPMFIITFIVNESLQKPEILFPTLVILYASPLIYALLLNPFYRKTLKGETVCHTKKVSKAQINFELIDTCIMNGFENITKLGGYIILFAIISGVIQVIPIGSPIIKYTLIGCTEITNGIKTISSANIPFHYQYILLLGITSFGGLSSIAQTKSMIKESNLSLNKYILSKLVTTAITIILSFIFLT